MFFHNPKGPEMKTCNTCCRPAASPFRVFDDRGKVTMGCVDEFHTDHLTPLSESARWHARPEAKKLRKAMAAFRRA